MNRVRKSKSAISSEWRPCPAGEHWRKGHIQPTYTRKDGVTVHTHWISEGCCENPSKKDQIYSEELKKISEKSFPALKGPPTADNLGFKANGNKYDEFIRGWTQFWNDTLDPKDKLDANVVKALIASESGFKQNPPVNRLKARGLMQVTDSTRKVLGNARGELQDHLIHIPQKEITDASLNICAGVRWLFHKRDLASGRLKHQASWEEGVANYKGLLNKKDKRSVELMDRFRDYYSQLLKNQKKTNKLA